MLRITEDAAKRILNVMTKSGLNPSQDILIIFEKENVLKIAWVRENMSFDDCYIDFSQKKQLIDLNYIDSEIDVDIDVCEMNEKQGIIIKQP